VAAPATRDSGLCAEVLCAPRYYYRQRLIWSRHVRKSHRFCTVNIAVAIVGRPKHIVRALVIPSKSISFRYFSSNLSVATIAGEEVGFHSSLQFVAHSNNRLSDHTERLKQTPKADDHALFAVGRIRGLLDRWLVAVVDGHYRARSRDVGFRALRFARSSTTRSPDQKLPSYVRTATAARHSIRLWDDHQ